MIRVLCITARADIGGGPEHLFQLMTQGGEDVAFTVACPRDEPYHQRYVDLLGHDAVINIPHRAFRLDALRSLRREVQARSVDLIHSHGKGAGPYGRLVAAMRGRPSVHTFHGHHVDEYSTARRTCYFAYERAMSVLTAAAICVSAGERDQIRAARIVAEPKLHLIENGVAVPTTRAGPRPTDVLRIVAVNRYDQQKNPELLLGIARRLAADPDIGPFEICVLGQGERLKTCKTKICAEALSDRLILVGPSLNPREWFRRAHVFLSTSRWEGMPLAVLEAMSEGLSVLATDVVGNRDVIEHEHTGLLYPNEDAGCAVESLRRLKDARLRAQLGANARAAVIERFSIATMAQRTFNLYQSVLSRHGLRRVPT